MENTKNAETVQTSTTTKATAKAVPKTTSNPEVKGKVTENEWSKREVGALWKRKSATQFYLSGHVSLDFDKKYKIMIFTNKHKKTDAHPDYRVYLQDDKGAATKAEVSESKDEIL